MSKMLIFGMGYTASHLADRLNARGWDVVGTSRTPNENQIRFDDQAAVLNAMREATHILSSVPPAEGADPVLAAYGDALALVPVQWMGYL